MTLTVESAFSTEALGGIAMRINVHHVGLSSTTPVTHSDWSEVSSIFPSRVNTLAPNLELLIQFFAGDNNYSLSYDSSSKAYTISHSFATAFTVDFQSDGIPGYLMQSVLGFSSSLLTGAATYTSDVRPWFTLETPMECRHNVKPDYETGEKLFGGNNNGVIYGWAPPKIAKRYDFRISYVTRGDLYKHKATALRPWTWEDFLHQCRLGNYFFIEDDHGPSTAHKLRPDGSIFVPTETAPNYVGEYHLDLKTYVFR